MAISRIRGEQIKLGVLKNEHIHASAAIAESKLDVNWQGHYHSALQVKKVVDFIQVNGTSVSGTSYTIPSNLIPSSVPSVTSDSTDEGVIVSGEKNKAPVRDAQTGEPILDAGDNQVYGRVELADGDYTLKFYSLLGGVETAYSMPAATSINWQYAKRFNLDNVPEMFAANEKFVEGAADATAHLNIVQIAKDLYGDGFELDRDGNANLETNISQQIANEITARTNADQAIRNDLSDTANASKGANAVGVYDTDNRFTAGNVNDALIELHDEIADNKSDIESALASAVSDLESAIADEETARINAVNSVQSGLDLEILNRQNAISSEVSAREIADSTLQSNIDAEETARISAISAEETARSQADTTLQNNINAEASARESADTSLQNQLDTYKSDLNSASTGKGASLVKVDGGSGLTGSTVQDVLADLDSRLDYVEANGGAEVAATHSRESGTQYGNFPQANFNSLEERLVNIEDNADLALNGIAVALSDEITRATTKENQLQSELNATQTGAGLNEDGTYVNQGTANYISSATSLGNADELLDAAIKTEENARIASDDTLQDNIDAEEASRIAADEALDERVTTLEASKHDHFKAVYQVSGSNVSELALSSFGGGLPAYIVGDDSLDIYVNGILQNEGLHYSEVVGGQSINFDPANDGTVLEPGDIITIKYFI